jgi:arylsulfatase A-like enzyme
VENLALNEVDISDKPPWVATAPLLTQEELANERKMYVGQLRSLQAVDEMVEAIVDALKRAGKLDNTFIFFTSDNGFLFGEHRITSKGVPYEGSIRVPLIIRGPGIAKAQTRTELVNNLDVVATIEHLAELKPGRPPDGTSLLPLFSQNETVWRRALLVEGGARARESFSAIRTNDKKYVKYAEGFEEFYDLREDPFELRNLAKDPATLRELNELRDMHARLKDCRGVGCWLQ